MKNNLESVQESCSPFRFREVQSAKMSRQVRCRTLSLSLSSSRGAMVQELQTAAEDMQKLGEAMAELFERTAQAIRTGSLLFEQADNGAAKDWKG